MKVCNECEQPKRGVKLREIKSFLSKGKGAVVEQASTGHYELCNKCYKELNGATYTVMHYTTDEEGGKNDK